MNSNHGIMTSRSPNLRKLFARSASAGGFTLVELLLSMAVLSVLMLVVVNVIGIVQKTWVRANSRVSEFREARMAFDLLTRNLSQATLNIYWANEVDPLSKDAASQDRFKAKNYIRQSELQFVCGKTTHLLASASGGDTLYPGHGVFFQAPLGVTRLVASNGTTVNTENMVNLLCGRGYFVQWGDDTSFRPPFLNSINTVSPRFRYRLMEYSPTAESNQIYFDPTNPTNLAERRSITIRSKMWFQDALTRTVQQGDNAATRAFTRPVAENIIALVISPQLETSSTSGTDPTSIAPNYEYDSTQLTGASSASPQGNQHLLPPLLKVTMVAVDSAAGERMAETGNTGLQNTVASAVGPLFTSAINYNSPNSSYNQDLRTLQQVLTQNHINYRVFTSTVMMKQARWSR